MTERIGHADRLVGWVSDESYLALAGVRIEVDQDGEAVAQLRSSASGRFATDLPPGDYRLVFAHPGFGSKSVATTVPIAGPLQVRMLSDALVGFVWPRWVRSRERAELRFHAAEPYRLSLWRYGADKQFVRLLGWFDEHGPRSVMQITPDGDYTPTGVEWNRVGYGGNPHHSLMLEAPAAGGLHYVHAETESGAFFGAPWIVAPDSPSAPIAVLHSTNTWNAYNAFGGRSNYINAAGLPDRPIVNSRQDLGRYSEVMLSEWSPPDEDYPALSFERPEVANSVPPHERPEDPMRGRLSSSMAPAEWRLLAWLEREGFAYDTYADQQLHDGTLALSGYRILVICVHPEYWSRRMFERVQAFVASGGRLVSLGGNCLNCEVELPDGRSMRCRTQLTSDDGSLGMPHPGDPAVWFDSRFHRTVGPEAELLGSATTETGIMTAAPYRTLDASHWVFEGTDLRDGDVFGTESQHERCSGGASGHETDKRTEQTPASFHTVAKGLNPDDGGADILVREGIASEPGAVFSVGSITFVASLLVDDAISAITRNVLSRFLG